MEIYISILRGRKRSRKSQHLRDIEDADRWYFQAENKRTSGIGAAAENISIENRVAVLVTMVVVKHHDE